MGWADSLQRRGSQATFNQAWRRAQRLRAAVEKATQYVLKEMVTAGIDVAGPPQLGEFTPVWTPLSDSWEAKKGFDEFYFHKGDLEDALMGKNVQRQLGRPQVFLEWPGKSLKVNAGSPPKKYKDALPKEFYVRAVPFPRLSDAGADEAAVVGLIAEPESKTFYKLLGPHGLEGRPLVGPFLQWWLHVRLKGIMRGKV
jgi:hypothetical protein